MSKLWIAAAERTLVAELIDISQERIAEVRSHLRVAAATAEDMINLVAGPRGTARSSTIAAPVERFGDHALDIDYMGAAFSSRRLPRVRSWRSAWTRPRPTAWRAGAVRRCLIAGAVIDTLSALTTG